MHDRNHYVVDEMTQLPPHLLPPPYLVDIDGTAHSARHQEAILKLFRPIEQARQKRRRSENAVDDDDYDEYMRNLLSQIKHKHMFRHGRGVESGNSYQDRNALVRLSTRRVTEDSQMVPLGSSASSRGVSGSLENGLCSTDGLASQALPTYSAREEIGGVASNESATSVVEEGSSLVNGQFGSVAKEGIAAPLCDDETKANSDNRPVTVGSDNGLMVPGETQPSGMGASASDTLRVASTREAWRGSTHGKRVANGRRAVGVLQTRQEEASIDGELAGREEGSVEVTEGSPEGENSQNMCSSLIYSLGLSETETKRSLSLWQNRVIVRHLDSARIAADQARCRQLYEDEETEYSVQIMRGREIAAAKVREGSWLS